eukprot:10369255-Alexandrium_andersonii.AAC.1
MDSSKWTTVLQAAANSSSFEWFLALCCRRPIAPLGPPPQAPPLCVRVRAGGPFGRASCGSVASPREER